MAAGYSTEQIASTLKQHGFSEEKIRHLFLNHKPKHPHSHVHSVALIALFVMVIMLAAGVLYYIHESDELFLESEKESQVQAVQETPNSTEILRPKKDIMSFIREDIVPSIVAVECFDKNDEILGRGSGFYFELNGSHYVGTNAHVVVAPDKKFYGCYVYFPMEDGGFYKHSYYADEAYFYHDQVSNVSGTLVWGIDYAELVLKGEAQDPNQSISPFPPLVEGIYHSMGLYCNESRYIELGDKLYVLGYPAVGSDSLTITEGIVSGFLGDFSEWVKVSANINPGNSGGVTIAENGCMYGIPTQLISDYSGSIGQILRSGHINDFILNNMGIIDLSQNQKVGSLIFETYEGKDFGFSIDYPIYWEVIEGYDSIGFESPSEHLFDVQERLVVKLIPLSGTFSANEELESVQAAYEELGIEVVSSQKGTFKGYPSITMILPPEDGKQITQVVVVKQEVAYALTEYIDSDNPNHYSSVLEEMLDSFQMIPLG